MRAGRVRWRAVVVGVLLTVWINAFDPIARYLVRSSSFTDSHLPFTLLLGVLAVAYVYNPWARRCAPKQRKQRAWHVAKAYPLWAQ
jgi:hypothetical protein